MKTVKQVSAMTGVSPRTIHHYDAVGLLKPTCVTEAGYRLYDGPAVERLKRILLLRELGFSLKEIGELLDAPEQEQSRQLDRQLRQLQEKSERLKKRIALAEGLRGTQMKFLELEDFQVSKMEDYSAQAKALYGKTDAYKEYAQKAAKRSRETETALGGQVMEFFVRLGQLRHLDPGSEQVQTWVAELQAFFTEHYYTCTKPILHSLGQSYAGGGSMNENIDAAGGKGTGAFACRAIEIYCEKP